MTINSNSIVIRSVFAPLWLVNGLTRPNSMTSMKKKIKIVRCWNTLQTSKVYIRFSTVRIWFWKVIWKVKFYVLFSFECSIIGMFVLSAVFWFTVRVSVFIFFLLFRNILCVPSSARIWEELRAYWKLAHLWRMSASCDRKWKKIWNRQICGEGGERTLTSDGKTESSLTTIHRSNTEKIVLQMLSIWV